MRHALVAGIALLGAATTRADTRYPRVQNVKVPPATLAAPAPPMPPVDVSFAEVASPPGFLDPVLTPQQVAQLERMPSPGPDDLRELATDYAKQMLRARDNAVAHQLAADAAPDAARKAAAQRDAATAQRLAKDYLLKAVKTYKRLVDDPAQASYSRMDDALYGYGFVLAGGKYMKEARAVFDKLLKDYPASAHVPLAHLAFGEYYLEANQLADAEARMKMVLKFPKSPAYWFAMLRMGRIHFQLKRFQEALESEFQVANATRRDPAQAKLHDAAEHAFVEAYAEIGKADKAYPAFQRVDTAHAFEMLTELAGVYAATGKHDKAAYAYGELLRLAPTSPSACTWQVGVVRATAANGASPAERATNVENLVQLRAALEAKNVLTGDAAERCRAQTIEVAGAIARTLHADALRTGDAGQLAAARRVYDAYDRELAGAPDATAMRLLDAEAAWTLAETETSATRRRELWGRAGDAFTRVAATAPRANDAALAAVLAWKNALDVDPSFAVQAGAFDVTVPPPPVPTATQLDARAAALVAAIDVYAKAIGNPDDDELVRDRFLAATLYRAVNQLDRATDILVEIVPRLGRRADPSWETAALVLLDTLARRHLFDRVLEVADQLAANRAALDKAPALRRAIEYLRTHSLRH